MSWWRDSVDGKWCRRAQSRWRWRFQARTPARAAVTCNCSEDADEEQGADTACRRTPVGQAVGEAVRAKRSPMPLLHLTR